ncbi:MFS transporter [Spongiibacter nanhainus]|uniref:MFS transporter n=1 Tax=Spongiibacter nanhainus TaxID=2794344 RepID=A0A7T4R0G4_9GAMM|nr:MFS transporter [Spongiibacter nanhainus]QQD18150.1 MFS transporter [Spongiibacter nanhainus]
MSRFPSLLRYALPGLPLAALGLPFYIYAPLWLAEQGGYGYTLVGAVFFIARFSDVLTDLPVGVAVDRWGIRRRFWLLAWGLVAGSALALMYLPHPWPAGLLALALVALMLGWTGINVPWLALPVWLSRDHSDRLAYNSAREAMLLFGTLLAMVAPSVLPSSILHLVLPPLLTLLLLAVWVQGRHLAPPSSAKAGNFASLLVDRRVAQLALPWFINMLANAIPGSILVLFMREVLGAESLIPVALLSYFLAGLVGVPFWYMLARRWGDLLTWRIGLLSSAVLFSFAALLGEGQAGWFIAISIGTGLALGADQAIPSAMQTGLAQSLMAERGGDAIAARLFALWSLLSKAAMGLAVGIAYLWLGSSVNPEAQQTVPPDWAISAAYVLAPVVLKLAVFSMLGRSNIKQQWGGLNYAG